MNKIYPTEQFKEHREKSNYTQELLADHSGVSVRTIQNIEAGRGCKVDTLKDLSSVLDIPFTQFLPKPSTSKYQGSWVMLLFEFGIYGMLKPAFYSIVLILAFIGFINVYAAFDRAGMINHPTAEEQANFDTFMRERYKGQAPIKLPTKVYINESEKLHDYIYITVESFLLIYLFFGAFGAIQWANRSRDFEVLINNPLDAFYARLYNRFQRLVKMI